MIASLSFKPVLQAPTPAHLIWLATGSVAAAEFALAARPDALVIDLQHGLWERQAFEAVVGVAGSHCPVLARCNDRQASAIGNALDAGVGGILVPLIESADQARAAVAACQYPPRGIRSAGGVRPLMGGIDGMMTLGEQVAIGLMIETQAGVEQAEAIAAVPGIDFLFIGTGDLALSLNRPDATTLDRACQRVQDAARRHGLPCGIFTGDAATARHRIEAGYGLAVCANDLEILQQGFFRATRTARLAGGA